MKALTFVCMILLAVSGATAQSVSAQSSNMDITAGKTTALADFTNQRICMRCLVGG